MDADCRHHHTPRAAEQAPRSGISQEGGGALRLMVRLMVGSCVVTSHSLPLSLSLSLAAREDHGKRHENDENER